jgi:hypothetical protein
VSDSKTVIKELPRVIRYIFLGVMLLFAGIMLYHLCHFLFRGGIVMAGIWKLLGLMWWMLKKVFWATLPCLIAPIAAYAVIYKSTRNEVLRFIAGLGFIYVFYLFSGDISFSLDSVLNMVKFAFQLYFLILLVIPGTLMIVAGAVASIIGTIIIYILPDLPGVLDDIGAICILIAIVFVYMNTLATAVKKLVCNAWLYADAKLSQRGKPS